MATYFALTFAISWGGVLIVVGPDGFMVWAYDRTESLLVGMLMHLSLTASVRIIGAPGITGLPLLIFDFAWFAAVWAVIAAIVVANGTSLSRRSLQRRMA